MNKETSEGRFYLLVRGKHNILDQPFPFRCRSIASLLVHIEDSRNWIKKQQKKKTSPHILDTFI